MALFQSLGMVALFNDISSSLARKGIMASKPNFRISPGTPPGPTDLFLPIFNNLSLIIIGEWDSVVVRALRY